MTRTADDQVKSQRTIAERAGVRWPSMARRTMRWVLRLPPGSLVRRAMLERAARIAFLSWNRGDFALVPHLDDPEVEIHVTVGGHVAAGLDDVYHGPEGHCRAMAIWNEAWPEWDAKIERAIDPDRGRALDALGATAGLQEWAMSRENVEMQKFEFQESRLSTRKRLLGVP